MTGSPKQVVRDVLERLSVLPDRKQELDWASEYLAGAIFFAQLNDGPQLVEKGPGAARKELEALADLALSLKVLFGELHKEASEAIRESRAERDPDIDQFKRDLVRVYKMILRAREPFADVEPVSKPGREPKLVEAEITAAAASVFEHLTGGRFALRNVPDGEAYGPALDFLTDLFSALQIQASPQSQLKSYMEKTNRK